jgi:hypothetical protein
LQNLNKGGQKPTKYWKAKGPETMDTDMAKVGEEEEVNNATTK